MNQPAPLRLPISAPENLVALGTDATARAEPRLPVTWISPLGLPPFPESGSISLGDIFGSARPEVPLSDELRARLGRARRHCYAIDGADGTDEISAARSVMVALSGLPVAHSGRPRVLPGVHPDLARAIQAAPKQVVAGEGQRRASLVQRRLALLRHGAHRPGMELSVTALAASRRPEMFDRVVGQVAAQRHVEVELVVGAHGWEPDREAVSRARARMPGELKIVTIDRTEPLGSVLNRMLAVADGRFVSKWDDDDLYGPHHLVDLLLAWSYSGADLVGKGAEHVFLSGRDVTIRRYWGGAESFSSTVSGATLTMELERLREVGGFEPGRSRGEDTALIAAVTESGGTVYRTHGYEFVVIRADDGTWPVDERRLLAQSDDIRPGLDTGFAGWW